MGSSPLPPTPSPSGEGEKTSAPAGNVSAGEGENSLEGLLRRRIAERGSLSFREFMEAALYHPRYGYYTNLRGFGEEGDFVTSPEVHPVFGALLARQAVEVWEALRAPSPFWVLEYGAGSGALARSLLEWVRHERPDFGEALRYAIEEPSPSLRAVQETALVGYRVRWGLSERSAHLVLANEVLDALPVVRVVRRGGELRELRVGLDASGEFAWVEAPGVPEAVREYFAVVGVLPPEGGVAEVNLDITEWVRALAARLGRGLALILDYGYPAEELFRRAQGTLLTYYRHSLGSDPLVRLGRQDISVHVDFTSLATAAHRAGLTVLGLTSQQRLLRNLGLGAFLTRLERPADRAAVARLADPAGLGRIGALFVSRGLEGYVPTGLSGGRAWDPPGWVPQLGEPPVEDDGFLEQWREAFGE